MSDLMPSTPGSPIATRPPGLLDGARQLFAALQFVATTPASWPMSLVPAVLFALLFTFGTIAGVVWLTPWLLSFMPAGEGFWLTLAEWGARFLLYAASLLLGAWTALLLTPPLSGPALEHLVGLQERALLVTPRAESSFLRELWLGVAAQATALAFAVPLLVGLWFVDFFVPPAAILTKPLQALITALAIAWSLFDYPLTLRGIAASERIGFVAAHYRPVLGFGLAFAALFWIPCFGVLMLPVGVVGATRLLYLLLERDPTELPTLPRPRTAELPAPRPFTQLEADGPEGQRSARQDPADLRSE